MKQVVRLKASGVALTSQEPSDDVLRRALFGYRGTKYIAEPEVLNPARSANGASAPIHPHRITFGRNMQGRLATLKIQRQRNN